MHEAHAVAQREIEVERVGVEQAGGHRLEAVVGRDLARELAVARGGIDDLAGQLALRLAGEFEQRGLQVDAQRAQRPG